MVRSPGRPVPHAEAPLRVTGAVLGENSAGERHFHCVETPKPAAMKPKPARMFQLPQSWIGQLPLVT